MKIYLKIALALSGAISLVTLAASIFLLRSLLENGERYESAGTARFHLALFVPRDGGPFFEGIAEGAARAAAENDAALSIHYFGTDASALSFAPDLGANGVAVCPVSDSAAVRDRLDAIAAAGTPLVLVNRTIPAEQPRPFIGANNYDYGKKAGVLIAGAAREKGTLAVLYSDKAPSVFAERELFEMGLNGSLAGRLAGSISSWKTGLNPQDAEHIVYELVHSTPDLAAVVFTDEHDTVVGCQALIDLNLVGRITIVGAGSGDQITEYVRKGIIAGSVVIDPELLGAEAMRSLVELCASGYTSNSVDTGISVIDRENLARYRPGKDRP